MVGFTIYGLPTLKLSLLFPQCLDVPILIQLTASDTTVVEGSSFEVCGKVLLAGSVGNVSIIVPLLADFSLQTSGSYVNSIFLEGLL